MPAAKFALKSKPLKTQFHTQLRALPVQWVEKPEQYCDYRLDGTASGGWLRVKQYTNGTLYLEASTEDLLERLQSCLPASAQVKGTGAQSTAKKATSSAKTPKVGISPSGVVDIQGTYIGTDESGKGDYFGPLVVAGVLVTEETQRQLKALGVMDSKQLTEGKIQQLYRQILDCVGEDAVASVVLRPEKYNDLYQRLKSGGKNLNHLLAWGHGVVMDELFKRHPECQQAIADQFGDERYIQSQLGSHLAHVRLYQTPRAEANVGVAAASVVARYRFVDTVRELAEQFESPLPLGAGSQVISAGKRFVAKHGRQALAQVAKLHFKTTESLG